MAETKVVRWHRMPFAQFVSYEASRPMFRPFLIGAAYVLASFELDCVLVYASDCHATPN